MKYTYVRLATVWHVRFLSIPINWRGCFSAGSWKREFSDTNLEIGKPSWCSDWMLHAVLVRVKVTDEDWNIQSKHQQGFRSQSWHQRTPFSIYSKYW